MMLISTKFRTDKPEIMDDFAMEGELLRDALDKIAAINQLLGGNSITIEGIKKLVEQHPKSIIITIVDIGCGNGDMLRKVSRFGKENGYNFILIGIDANSFTIDHAKKLSEKYGDIKYFKQDIFAPEFAQMKYDIVLCTLTLHHFKEAEIANLLHLFYENSTIGIVINDLERSRLAYYLFKLLCFVFNLNDMSREDGLTSILRGFKKPELHAFSKKLNFKKYSVHWKWAFRYQWIIQKT